MRAYFADTFYWIALIYPQDAFHSQVSLWANANSTARLVTTEEVLSELLTWFAGSGAGGRRGAAAAVRSIVADPLVQVLAQTSSGFYEAVALYESRPDKDYSLVDCRSMVAMKSLGVMEVLSNDHHFSQEGFSVVFP